MELIKKLKGKVPRMKKIVADHGYKESFIEYVEAKTNWKVEIARGAPHRVMPDRDQNHLKDLSLRRTDGRWKEPMDGSILEDDFVEII